jgi:hypothetical protein
LLLPIAAGGLLALSGRITSQLWPQALFCGFAAAAGVVAGLTAPGRRREHAHPVMAGLFVAAAAMVLPGLFRPLIALALWINAEVSSQSAIFGLRALCVAAMACPAGIALGMAARRGTGREQGAWQSVCMLMFALGWVLTRWLLVEMATAAAAIAAAGAVFAVFSAVRSGEFLPRGRSRRAGLAACGAAGVIGALAPQFDAGRSARLLFSGRVAAASRSPADADLLEALDETRLVRVEQGTESIWTLWKARGDQLQWRENGYPHAGASLDLSVSPESAAELASAVVPLAVHPRAEHMLIVGAGSGATLRGALEFPLRSVTCWEQDGDLLKLLAEAVQGEHAAWLEDPRLVLQRISPLWGAAAASPQRYDVILLNERQQATWRTVGLRTTAAFERWRGRLSPTGLLCVRLEYVDFGAPPVLDLTRTLSAVFPQVLIWESSPGELLMLATASERPLIEEPLLERIQSPQSRRALGQMGWDCSLPLSLVTVKGDELLAANPEGGTAMSAANLHTEFAWPVEISRWAFKGAEIQALLTPLAQPALARLPDSPERNAIQQRLADVQEQRSLVTRFPDHYWAYRKVLRERLQERPRSVIQQMKHELHPDDERRKEYLAALGAAATAGAPSREQLQQVADFAAPFDPLVSPFLHREVAHLAERARPDDRALALEHWLHAVYFSPAFDRSIRDATAALRLLVEHPELIADPARRWDHLNSLLEVLKERWHTRSQQANLSRFESADVSETITAASAALDELRRSAATAGIDAEWAELRCRVIDRTLVRALRSHHAQQVVRQQELARQQAAREQSNVR